jgi:diguanylate cyclase (GGDEF)-like protein
VPSTRLGDRARNKLVHLLSNDRPEPEHWLARLKTLREIENAPIFATALRILFHLDLDESAAEGILARVLEHRAQLTAALTRDPGIRVAAMDFFSNVEKKYDNPAIVEMGDYEETERSARTDTVTGLANRREFEEVLEREVRRSRRYRWPLTMLMLDLDHFKDVNDAYGHMLGDLVLARVGGILRRAVRDADAACRYGGEEFVVILPETERVGGFVVAERIRRRVEDAFRARKTGGHDVPMTVSTGLASFPEDAAHAAEIVSRSDEALYIAKRAGRNRVCVHFDEKRRAPRFPAKAGASVRLVAPGGGDARAIDFSLTGMLLETAAAPPVAASVALHLDRIGPRDSVAEREVFGRVARVASDRAGGGRALVGVAFDAPLGEDDLRPRVTFSRASGRSPRGAPR